MDKDDSGKIPVIDIAKCVKCSKCIIICPAQAIVNERSMSCARCIKYCITMEVPCNTDNYIFDYQKCNSCGLCISECDQNAISMINSFEKM
jgi:Pyruvate/2-oxoacid:ferredoxin oxidoreductase delta subunit